MILSLCAATSFATVVRVPQDYATIQAALDGVADGDTVYVAAAYYFESLQAPGIAFVLIGAVNPGGNPAQPVIDPSPLDGSTHLSCLHLPSECEVVVSQITFRNGPAMYPREHGSDVGGIRNGAASLTLSHCRFDSTYKGIFCGAGTSGELTISDCDFVNNVQGCIEDYSPSRTSVFNSSFSGRGDRLAYFADSARVENCTFHDVPYGAEWLWLSGQGTTVRGCSFGPTTVPMYDIIWTQISSGCVFENNLFHDLEVTGAAIFFHGDSTDTTYFRNNVFRNIQGVTAAIAGSGIATSRSGLTNPRVVIQDCVFDSCFGATENAFGALSTYLTDALCRKNYFTATGFPAPTVLATGNNNGIRLRENFFQNTGWALRSEEWLDAENNWWGDPSGPYHATLNPQGLGDSIVGWADFDPWLTDTTLTALDPRAPIPQAISLDVYPNPFNASATLKLSVNEPGIFTVELFNPLGQRVREVWHGSVAHEKQLSFDGAGLSSGLYFVRVDQPLERRVVALQKIVLMK